MAGNKNIAAYAKAKFMMSLKMRMWRILVYSRFCVVLTLAVGSQAWATGPWDQPAAQLAAQIAEILGSGQAQLVLNNRSTIAAQELPAIRRQLEQDLRARGVATSGAESANVIRVTLSENVRERLWVAEIIEGNQTQIAMVHVERGPLATPDRATGMTLQKRWVWDSADSMPASDAPVLAALETRAGLVILEQEQILILSRTPAGWHEEKRSNFDTSKPLARDSRGLLKPAADGNGFIAIVPGRECDGTYAPAVDASGQRGEWSVRCRESDDPWPVNSGPIKASPTETAPPELHAFYNASRNFFTGVITPNQGVDVMPFYSMAGLTRAAGRSALLVNGLDGKVHLVEANSLKAVTGTRDWGSDFALLNSSCGAGMQIIASGSDDAERDSLRAYELPAQEAVAVSAPLEADGTVTALSTAPDGASVWAVVRKSAKDYEVDRVAALCQ
jgi:hypothetical protein